MDKIKVLVAGGQRLFVDALRRALAELTELSVIEESPTAGLDAIKVALRARPDVAVLDYWLYGMYAPAVTAMLRKKLPHCRILVVAASWTPAEVEAASAAGAELLLAKNCRFSQLVDAILSLPPASELRASPEKLGETTDPANERSVWFRIGLLTPREVEVLEQISQLPRQAEVATALGLSPRTVRNHLHHIMKKVQVNSVSELIAVARRHGMLMIVGAMDLRSATSRVFSKMRMPSRPIRVLVAGGERLLVEALKMALRTYPGLRVSEALPSSYAEVITLVEDESLDVILLDYWIPGGGLETLSALADIDERVKALVISWAYSNEHIRAAVVAGAAGFLPMGVTVDDVVEAIYTSKTGSNLGEQGLAYRAEKEQGDDFAQTDDLLRHKAAQLMQVLDNRIATSADQLIRFRSLSRQQFEILGFLASGLGIAEIARRLEIAPATVQVHIREALRKLGARSRNEAITFAQRQGVMGLCGTRLWVRIPEEGANWHRGWS